MPLPWLIFSETSARFAAARRRSLKSGLTIGSVENELGQGALRGDELGAEARQIARRSVEIGEDALRLFAAFQEHADRTLARFEFLDDAFERCRRAFHVRHCSLEVGERGCALLAVVHHLPEQPFPVLDRGQDVA